MLRPSEEAVGFLADFNTAMSQKFAVIGQAVRRPR
jgi:hypothetical protein